jgi:hypothetical protein
VSYRDVEDLRVDARFAHQRTAATVAAPATAVNQRPYCPKIPPRSLERAGTIECR